MSTLPLLTAFLLTLLSLQTQAATLLIDDTRLLRGATNVIASNAVYDVSFTEGTCQGLYDGCDSNADFLFPNQPAALNAARALLAQVLIDQFDTNPV